MVLQKPRFRGKIQHFEGHILNELEKLSLGSPGRDSYEVHAEKFEDFLKCITSVDSL